MYIHAIVYVDYLRTCTFLGVPFPRNFLQVCKKILTRLYRVFVHVYIHHFDKLISIGAVSFTYMMYMYTVVIIITKAGANIQY